MVYQEFEGHKNVSKRRMPLWFGIVVAVGLAIMAWPVIEIYYWGFGDNPRCAECKDETGFLRKLACGTWSWYDDLASHFRSPPTDEEMIDNFNKRRADLERLAEVYREDLSVPTCLGDLVPTREVQAIMERAQVKHIRGDSIIWMPPDPYSQELYSSRQRCELAAKSYDPVRRKFSGVIMYYSHATILGYKYHVHKSYYYVPLVPRMKNGKLKLPGDPYTGRLAPTLNGTYPTDFFGIGCVYRQIDVHWFIRVCEGV